MKKYIVTTLVFLSAQSALAFEEVSDTIHNLSISGRGAIRSQTESRVCIFCHTPHAASPEAPQWNRRSGGGYIPYQSSTAEAITGSTGSSRLCLSCHDGTIALGDMMSNAFSLDAGVDNLRSTFIVGRARLGTDLRDDHPVSIMYDSRLASVDANLVNPALVGLPVRGNELQCVSCHNVHSNSIQPFLQRTTLNGELCISCHDYSGASWNWSTSAHARSNAMPMGGDPWAERKPEWKGANVAENACMNCHAPHNAATPTRLIKDQEEETCYLCHDGTTAATNIRAEMQKFFRHPVDVTPSAGHDAMIRENPLTMPRHVECEDCHNPHASGGGPPMISLNPNSPSSSNHSIAPFINDSMAGVTGIDINGSVKAEAKYEYEVCFKCHGVPGKNACGTRRCPTAASYDMVRQDGTYNLRDKFDPGNPSLLSYHPVADNNPRNNQRVPSLRVDSSLNSVSSQIYCGDCHASERSPASGGAGPGGPHGSTYEGLLAMRYEFDPQSSGGGSRDGLCFKCHDSGILFSDVSFLHRKHVLEKNTSCINCHDPHGSAVYPHLLNFLTRANVAGRTWRITGAGGFSEPTWQGNGEFSGTCWLNCHGVVHDGRSYPEGADSGDVMGFSKSAWSRD